jgi:thioredoxin reductase
MLDAIVVGGSFAGLSAAMQLARARRRVLVVDGGLPRNRFAAASHGFLGQDGRPPGAIRRTGAAQLLAYPTVGLVHDEVTAAAPDGDGFAAALAGGRRERAARLILATGVRDELPPIPGLAERWGTTAVHCPYCHGYEVRDRPLAVLANHPMAAHVAALLPDWGPTTFFTQAVHEPDAEQAAHLAARGVAIERTPIVELLGDAPGLDAARLADGRVVPVGAVFVAPTVHLASPLARDLGCAIEEGALGPFVRVDDFKQTTVPGVFAAGDATAQLHNATFASASGVMAGVAAHRSLVFAPARSTTVPAER